MLIADFEKDIKKLGGKKIEYADLIKHATNYFDIEIGEYLESQNTLPTIEEFIEMYFEEQVSNEYIYYFYHIPFIALTYYEKFRKAFSMKFDRVKEPIHYVATKDKVNIDFHSSILPDSLSTSIIFPSSLSIRRSKLSSILSEDNLMLKNILNNLAKLEAEQIEEGSFFNNIEQYIECTKEIERFKKMSILEFIEAMTEWKAPKENEYRIFKLPKKQEYIVKYDTNWYDAYSETIEQIEFDFNKFIASKEIIILIGSTKDGVVETLVPIYPFDIKVDKQLDIVDRIFNRKKKCVRSSNNINLKRNNNS